MKECETMKRTISLILAGLFALLCAGCSGMSTTGESSCFTIQNDVPDQLQSIAVTFYAGEITVGSIAMEPDGSLLGREKSSFYLNYEDLPEGADLNHFRIVVSVTDADGVSHEVSDLSCIPEPGKDYHFQLRQIDGSYCLWMSFEGNEVGVSDGTSEEDSTPPDAAADPYEGIISQYREAVVNGWDAEQMDEHGLNRLVPDFVRDRETVGYYEGDLNGDGVPELAISSRKQEGAYRGMLFALYELVDGQPALLVESGERNRWYFAGEGTLYNEASSSAEQSCVSLCTLNFDLAYLDAVEYNGTEYPDDPWLQFTGETWKHISESEANTAMEQMAKMVEVLNLTSLN